MYEPAPFLKLEWDPDRRPDISRSPQSDSSPHGPANGAAHFAETGLAPHPADVFPSAFSPTPSQLNTTADSQGAKKQSLKVNGQEIWFYQGNAASFTFWRFMLRIPLGQYSMAIQYQVNGGLPLEFHVPARGEDMRIAAYSVRFPPLARRRVP